MSISNAGDFGGELGYKEIGNSLLGVASEVTNNLFSDSGKYVNDLPVEIKARVFFAHKDNKSLRIINALKMQKNVKNIELNDLKKESLSVIANDVNGCFFHYTGNCVLLAAVVLYNLINKTNALSVNNTPPFYAPIDPWIANDILFGKQLSITSGTFNSVNDLEWAILRIHSRYKENFYVIESKGFRVPIIGVTCDHHFNAVVLRDEFQQPYVQFVDAWKTSNYTPSKAELAQRYRNGMFKISFLETKDSSSG